MDESAIQNLDYLRELIALVRSASEMEDMASLRMLQYQAPMTTEPQEDR